VPKRERHRLVAGLPVEGGLRQERIDDDERRKPEGQPVHRPRAKGQGAGAPGVEGDPRERHREQDLLPGRDRGEHAAAHARPVERSHRGVVEGEPDDEEVERDDRPPPDGDRGDGEEPSVEPELDDGHEGEGTAGGGRSPRPTAGLVRPPGLAAQGNRECRQDQQQEDGLDVQGVAGHVLLLGARSPSIEGLD
jgi:hypothetical protein